MLLRRGIKFYTSENEDLKAAVVERFNRTLKAKMYRYSTHTITKRYVDVLDDLLHHRSIGMSLAEVNEENESVVRSRLYPLKNRKSYTWKYDVGDRVRIIMRRQPFRKSYLGNWSEEIFEIALRLLTMPVTTS